MQLMSRKELAEILKVSSTTIDRLEKEGLPVLKIGPHSHRYDLEIVMKWFKKRQEKQSVKGGE